MPRGAAVSRRTPRPDRRDRRRGRGSSSRRGRTEPERPRVLARGRSRSSRPRVAAATPRGLAGRTPRARPEEDAAVRERRLARARPAPPPTIAAVDAVWCGARNGGRSTRGRPARSRPATEWMRVTSSACSIVSGGRMPRRRGEHRLPRAGRARKQELCRPAAASSSARRARSWPRTSARSGPPAPLPRSGGTTARGSKVPRR